MADQVLFNDTLASSQRTLGAANFTGYIYQTFKDSITAHSGGTQAGAISTATLSAAINTVSVVAAAADSVALPISVPGLAITIANGQATNSMQVFGQGTDVINAAATATGVAIPASKAATFYCTTAGFWKMVLSA